MVLETYSLRDHGCHAGRVRFALAEQRIITADPLQHIRLWRHSRNIAAYAVRLALYDPAIAVCAMQVMVLHILWLSLSERPDHFMLRKAHLLILNGGSKTNL